MRPMCIHIGGAPSSQVPTGFYSLLQVTVSVGLPTDAMVVGPNRLGITWSEDEPSTFVM